MMKDLVREQAIREEEALRNKDLFVLALREEKAKLSSNTAAKLAAKAWKDLEETKEVIDADS